MKTRSDAINRHKRARAMRRARIGQRTGNGLHRGSPDDALLRYKRPALSGVQAMPIDDRPTVATPDDDPYLWLEDIEGERALDFVDRQSLRTLEAFGGRQYVTDRDALAAIYDRTDNIPYVTRQGGLVYNLWKDAKNPRGLWRRTTLADFRNAEPGWETLLDIDRLATEEDKDWLLNWTQPLPGNSRVIIAL